MKRKLIKNSIKLFTLGLVLSVASSCTDKMEGLNEGNLKNIPPDDLKQDANEGGFLLPAMMRAVNHPGTGNQTQQNLLAESYANYLEAPSNFLGNVNPTTYVTKNIGWTGAWTIPTNGIMNNWVQMKKNGFDTKYPDLYAIALILKVAGGHRIVDTYGIYPYTEYGQTAEPKWNSSKEAYVAFFADLDVALASLKAAEAANPNADQVRFKKWDVTTFGGEYTKWIRLANTLRLRLAIRISNTADAALGKTEAEKAVAAANGGLMDETATGNWSVTAADGVNGHWTMTNAWSDTRISAAVITYLEGFGDPRLPVYALRATQTEVAGTYRGIRPGVDRPTKIPYQNYSFYNVGQFQPMKQVDGAESYFLRAEGALKGWAMGGTAKDLYEAGIRASLKINGVAEGSYLNSTTMQLAYVDPRRANNEYNSPRLTDVTVKWDDALTNEQKLEKIITQKWIAVFPEGTEAWSEFRRTGYPKLYHIMAPQNPILPLGTFIKRPTIPAAVAAASQKQYDAAVAAHLGGKDEENVKFYWMK